MPRVNGIYDMDAIQNIQTAMVIQQAREDYATVVKSWQKRHDSEIKEAVLFIEPRYRNSPVMRKEDL